MVRLAAGLQLRPNQDVGVLPRWSVDPILTPFKMLPVTGRLLGYAGKPNQKAAEVQTKDIIVDMDPGKLSRVWTLRNW